jgi:hypothetical protein
MTTNLTYRDLGHIKIIENLFSIIRSVGHSTHYFQQACKSNLLVTVFAARRLDRSVAAKNNTPQPRLSINANAQRTNGLTARLRRKYRAIKS